MTMAEIAARVAREISPPERRDITGPNILSITRQVLRATCKTNLSSVTQEELTERVQDVVMRAAIIQFKNAL